MEINADNSDNNNEDGNDYAINEDIKTNYKKAITLTIIWQSCVFLIYFFILWSQIDDFLLLYKASPECFIFMVSNLALYLLGVIGGIIGLILSEHYKIMIRCGYCFTGILVCFTFYGVSITAEMY